MPQEFTLPAHLSFKSIFNLLSAVRPTRLAVTGMSVTGTKYAIRCLVASREHRSLALTTAIRVRPTVIQRADVSTHLLRTERYVWTATLATGMKRANPVIASQEHRSLVLTTAIRVRPTVIQRAGVSTHPFRTELHAETATLVTGMKRANLVIASQEHRLLVLTTVICARPTPATP